MVKSKILNITEIEDGLKTLINNLNKKEFITQLLGLYNISKTSITRAKSKFDKGEPFFIKNKLYYTEKEGDVVATIDTIEQSIQDQKTKPRYIIVTNFSNIAALDTKTRTTLNIPLEELPVKADFFLAWNGIEKADYQAENPADRKAAERFAKLYDVLAKDNPNIDEHAFNLFLIRVLFLLFAEDTGITSKGAFTNVLKTRTAKDGSDFNVIIKELFEILNVNYFNRDGKEEWLLKFPYVNGNLFGEPHISLIFTKFSRELLIEAGELLEWNQINPDILGAMIQSVASVEDRQIAGMHYTSVPNIKKVIKPLFLDELNGLFENIKARYSENKVKDITDKTRQENNKLILLDLEKLHARISEIKFLDPACGSGNFLIITYKEIRRLEIKIILLEQKIEQTDQMPISSIRLNNFNGIEMDDFAHEVAKISLWIAEHQMNEEMQTAIPGTITELLPLKDAGNIVHGNSLRLDWNTVLPHNKADEVYLIGNPPYKGSKKQKASQKKDIKFVFSKIVRKYSELDYISAWFYLGLCYIQDTQARLAFVSTNSITQGEQVGILWPTLLEKNAKINFAYRSFKWANSAKRNAVVTVIIIGLVDKNHFRGNAKIFDNNKVEAVQNISPYLTSGENVIVKERGETLSKLPPMNFGSMPNGKNLILSYEEKEKIVSTEIEASQFIKPFMGADEYINDFLRFAIWVEDSQYEQANKISLLSRRFEQVRLARINSSRAATRKLANKPWSFGENRHQNKMGIIVPAVSSETREYVPIGLVPGNVILSNRVYQLYDARLWVLGIISSRMHMVWLRAIGGKMKTDFNYSSGVVYNTFPVKDLSTQRKNEIERVMLEIMDLREYEGGTLAQLYNKDTMPESLRKKHAELDGIVDRAYQQRTFESDEERLSVLLKLYQEMTSNNE
ncbi:class I SAM-dependent DNA methyltransferase [Leuconostoc mesenteroides]|uniref:class I SAM-dependent DNA methyltransferase n=1 Tax=Leuconostoc mesenteroides TaxID=1245 RepID=UPI0015F5E36E|nr:DNA methyltransferase [Leuconostoc mesenteroides]MBA5972967.1 class I SAM-dependent DNA methyltransferase [Leuconostoc mesenteroides]